MPVSRWIRRDGALVAAYPLVCYAAGQPTVTLDGDFTPAVLRAIADHMDRTASRGVVWPYLAPPPGG
jgi:hypothetical protein